MKEKKEGEKGLVQLNFAEVLATKHGGQILNPFEAKLVLSESKGHLYRMKGKFAISGTGYVHLNRIASINLVTPQNVVVDKMSYPNPNIERHPVTKAIETVNIRKMAIGFSPVGNIVAIDKTLFYNVYTYFIQSIQAKMKKSDGEECALYGTRRDRPSKEKGRWVFFETVRPLGIWINYTHAAIISCLEEHTQRQRFGDRIAQKIAERNCLKDHPAIGVSPAAGRFAAGDTQTENGLADVKVWGWRHELDSIAIRGVADRAERGDGSIKTEESIIDAEVEEEKEVIKETAEAAGEETEGAKTPAEMESPEEDPTYEPK